MEQTPLLKKVERTIAPMAETMGYEIVRILMVGAGSGRPTLQIMAERPDGTMLIDDCSRLSQAVSALLDVENLIEEAYYLEVSSPGIDRPLTRLKDFDRYQGFEVRIELDSPVNGQKKFKGVLKGLDGNTILLETDTGMASLPFHAVYKAKLVLTDDLIRAAMKAEKSSQKNKKKAGADVAGLPDDADIEIEEEDGADDDAGESFDEDAAAAKRRPAQNRAAPGKSNKSKNKKKTGS